MFGVPWKKPIRLITSFACLSSLARRCCHTEPHQILRGAAPSGVFWTKLACPYPKEFCEAFCDAVSGLAPQPTGPRAPRMTKQQVPHLPSSWTTVTRWHLVFQGAWSSEEHNNVLEARAAAALARHLARAPGLSPTKVLAFTDSLVVLGILAKGRSGVYALNRICHRRAALQLGTRVRFYWRYIASEVNPSDGPSRGLPVGVDPLTEQAHKYRGMPRRLKDYLLYRGEGHRDSRGAGL